MVFLVRMKRLLIATALVAAACGPAGPPRPTPGTYRAQVRPAPNGLMFFEAMATVSATADGYSVVVTMGSAPCVLNIIGVTGRLAADTTCNIAQLMQPQTSTTFQRAVLAAGYGAPTFGIELTGSPVEIFINNVPEYRP